MNPRRIVRIAFICDTIILLIILLFLWASGGIQSPGIRQDRIYDFSSGSASAAPADYRLTVLTWNISYAYGIGSSGEGYVPRSSAEMRRRLEGIARVIRENGADIVLLQEVDFDSHRSYHIDQLKELARITGLSYAARAVSWKAGYVPFPFGPPANHFGAVYSGGTVLSRYPIIFNQVILYPKPRTNSWLHNMFYLFRYSQKVKIQYGKEEICVVNNHLEAYDKGDRAEQAYELASIVKGLTSSKKMIIFGGDMNAVPDKAAMKYDFPDDKRDDYRGDTTIGVLKTLSGFKEVVKDEEYENNEVAFFTFPANAPNRRLDYLFVPQDATVLNAQVIAAGDLSDHLPLRADLILKEDK